MCARILNSLWAVKRWDGFATHFTSKLFHYFILIRRQRSSIHFPLFSKSNRNDSNWIKALINRLMLDRNSNQCHNFKMHGILFFFLFQRNSKLYSRVCKIVSDWMRHKWISIVKMSGKNKTLSIRHCKTKEGTRCYAFVLYLYVCVCVSFFWNGANCRFEQHKWPTSVVQRTHITTNSRQSH